MTDEQLEAQSWAYALNHDGQATTGDVCMIQDGYKAGFHAAREALPMKRFQVFCMDKYYPGGGRNDVIGEADELIDAVAIAQNGMTNGFEPEAQILDMQERVWLSEADFLPKEPQA